MGLKNALMFVAFLALASFNIVASQTGDEDCPFTPGNLTCNIADFFIVPLPPEKRTLWMDCWKCCGESALV